MKDKILKFIKEKKEIFIFVGVVLVVFGSVLGITMIAKSGSEPISKTIDDSTTTGTTTNDDNNTNTLPPVVLEKMILPIEGDFEIVRYYFDVLDEETLPQAVIVNGGIYEESKGVSYAKADNEEFDCLTVFSGKVIDIQNDSLDGMIVTISHDEGITSVYSCLKEVTVSLDQEVSIGDKIGVSGTSLFDVDAGCHVRLEILKNNEYVNPINAYNKELAEIQVSATK